MALPVAMSTADCAVLSFSAGLAMSASPAITKPCKEKFSEHQSGMPVTDEELYKGKLLHSSVLILLHYAGAGMHSVSH